MIGFAMASTSFCFDVYSSLSASGFSSNQSSASLIVFSISSLSSADSLSATPFSSSSSVFFLRGMDGEEYWPDHESVPLASRWRRHHRRDASTSSAAEMSG